MQEYKLFINGEWIESSSGEMFDDINPATLELIGKLHRANKDDVNNAVDAAEDAFDDLEQHTCPPACKDFIQGGTDA